MFDVVKYTTAYDSVNCTAQKVKLPLRIYSVNVFKSAGNCEFGRIY